jgi:hypothetical protein
MKFKQVAILSIIFIILLGVGCSQLRYQFDREWNYSRAYEGKVQETICEMVKPEYLKNPKDC